jgi:hypothetical protein
MATLSEEPEPGMPGCDGRPTDIEKTAEFPLVNEQRHAVTADMAGAYPELCGIFGMFEANAGLLRVVATSP